MNRHASVALVHVHAPAPSSSSSQVKSQSQGRHTAQLAMSWVLVGIPLAYGLYETIVRAAKLFTG